MAKQLSGADQWCKAAQWRNSVVQNSGAKQLSGAAQWCKSVVQNSSVV